MVMRPFLCVVALVVAQRNVANTVVICCQQTLDTV